MPSLKFQGSMVALVTPMKDGKVDEKALRQLVEWHITSGTSAIVPCGTTGESATLSHEEHHQVIKITIDQVKKRVPVMAGTGSNSTWETIDLTRHAEEAGADAALLITPYYNKPTPEGLYHHYKAVNDAVKIPLFLYNVPGRTALNMRPETVARCATLSHVVGIKEASGSLEQVAEVIEKCGDDFIVLSGEDSLTYPILTLGGKGVISVTANILPQKVAALCTAAAQEDYKKARELHYELLDLSNILFVETNPIPVKAALHLMGKIGDEIRLPLWKLSENNLPRLKDVLKSYGVLPS